MLEGDLPDDLPYLGSGGRLGTVRRLSNDEAYKRYHAPVGEGAHLEALINWRLQLNAGDREILDHYCAWPRRRVVGPAGTVGFIMPSAPAEFWQDMDGEAHTRELQHLVHIDKARTLGVPDPTPLQRLQLTSALAEILELFDRNDVVYGDISERNVLWSVDPDPRIYLLDCDNTQLLGRSSPPTGVAFTAGWSDSRRGDEPPNKDSDRFALGSSS